MNRRNPRRKPMAEINVVPYIDVTLVLLVIFMVTAPLQQSSVKVDLPVANGSPIKAQDSPPLLISVTKEGEYYLSEDGEKGVAILMDDLLEKIIAIYEKKPESQIYIRGDKAVEYSYIVNVMAALKQADITSVGLMTSQEE